MNKLLWIAGLVLFIYSCDSTSNEETVKTPSGIEITYYEKGSEDAKLVSTNVIGMYANYTLADGKDLVKTEPNEPLFLQYDSSYSVDETGLIQEVFERLSVGDSVGFEIPAKNLWEVSFRRPVPDTVDTESMVTIRLKIESQRTIPEYQEYMRSKEENDNAGAYTEEEAVLEKFLDENNLSPEVTESGLRYTIVENTNGEYPKIGENVSVKYKGMLLDGSVFDEGTYTFPLGQGQVIAGWDEGIGYLREGEKGVLYIPSKLGYGSRGAGANIPPFSSLIFEVELLEIK